MHGRIIARSPMPASSDDGGFGSVDALLLKAFGGEGRPDRDYAVAIDICCNGAGNLERETYTSFCLVSGHVDRRRMNQMKKSCLSSRDIGLLHIHPAAECQWRWRAQGLSYSACLEWHCQL